MNNEDFKKLGVWLNDLLKTYNYQVAPLAAAGKPGKNKKSMREFRLQLINKSNDTSARLIDALPNILKKQDNVSGVVFNKISPNSSKFPSYSFTIVNQEIDLVIGRGANKGENFETQTVTDLAQFFKVAGATNSSMVELVVLLDEANKEFKDREIASVKQRTGSTKKEGVPIEKLGAIIGDIVLTDTTNKEWFISLKDVNGNTFSSYSGAATLFNTNGDLQPNSQGADFLSAFGVDLNLVQQGFDTRNKKKSIRKPIAVKKANAAELKSIFERAWGMNYFYVKRQPGGWKVFWIDRNKLNKLASNIRVTDIKYPNEKSKQISIFCENGESKYLVEMRNSKAGEYPNDIKIKVR